MNFIPVYRGITGRFTRPVFSMHSRTILGLKGLSVFGEILSKRRRITKSHNRCVRRSLDPSNFLSSRPWGNGFGHSIEQTHTGPAPRLSPRGPPRLRSGPTRDDGDGVRRSLEGSFFLDLRIACVSDGSDRM